MDQEYTTLAYPATLCMDCQTAEITDDEASIEKPEIMHKEPKKGTRPVTPDVKQMREEIFKDKDQKTILQDENTIVEEDFPTYSQDSQEYMGIKRSTFLIDPRGNIAYIWSNVKVKAHAEAVLKKLEELQ